MTEKQKTISAIADYLFANPMANRQAVLSMFAKSSQFSDRTIDRYTVEAKLQNKERVNIRERTITETIVKEAKKKAKILCLSRDDILRELEDDFKELKNIRRIEMENIEGKGTTSNGVCFSDQIKAVQARTTLAKQLWEMNGWDKEDDTPQDHINFIITEKIIKKDNGDTKSNNKL